MGAVPYTGAVPADSREAPLDPDTWLSKRLSEVLRHSAVDMGLEVGRDGFVRLWDIMATGRLGTFQEQDVIRVVDKNSKKRFTYMRNDLGELLVRANQGHTGTTGAAIEDTALLTEIRTVRDLGHEERPVHGTFMEHWPSIRQEGLRAMERNHVHFAARMPGGGAGGGAISGIRWNAEVLIFLDVAKFLKH